MPLRLARSGTNTSGSLTMAVQPAATSAANTRTTNGEQDSMMPPFSPSEGELNHALLDNRSTIATNCRLIMEGVWLCGVSGINGTGDIYLYNTTCNRTSCFDFEMRRSYQAYQPSNLTRVPLEALAEPSVRETTLSNANAAIKTSQALRY